MGAAVASAESKLIETKEAAGNKLDQLWRRIDEQRLRHRTPDQIVAWVIMGLLAAGLIHQFTRWSKATTIAVGLAGAFIGGIAANLTQVNLGLGPVLVRYEDLIASLAGGLIIVLAARAWAARRLRKNAARIAKGK
jgi:uncharacterized membrane protein YeaQ/YmgE (transglycosylase-associated protein family)